MSISSFFKSAISNIKQKSAELGFADKRISSLHVTYLLIKVDSSQPFPPAFLSAIGALSFLICNQIGFFNLFNKPIEYYVIGSNAFKFSVNFIIFTHAVLTLLSGAN